MEDKRKEQKKEGDQQIHFISEWKEKIKKIKLITVRIAFYYLLFLTKFLIYFFSFFFAQFRRKKKRHLMFLAINLQQFGLSRFVGDRTAAAATAA